MGQLVLSEYEFLALCGHLCLSQSLPFGYYDTSTGTAGLSVDSGNTDKNLCVYQHDFPCINIFLKINSSTTMSKSLYIVSSNNKNWIFHLFEWTSFMNQSSSSVVLHFLCFISHPLLHTLTFILLLLVLLLLFIILLFYTFTYKFTT